MEIEGHPQLHGVSWDGAREWHSAIVKKRAGPDLEVAAVLRGYFGTWKFNPLDFLPLHCLPSSLVASFF